MKAWWICGRELENWALRISTAIWISSTRGITVVTTLLLRKESATGTQPQRIKGFIRSQWRSYTVSETTMRCWDLQAARSPVLIITRGQLVTHLIIKGSAIIQTSSRNPVVAETEAGKGGRAMEGSTRPQSMKAAPGWKANLVSLTWEVSQLKTFNWLQYLRLISSQTDSMRDAHPTKVSRSSNPFFLHSQLMNTILSSLNFLNHHSLSISNWDNLWLHWMISRTLNLTQITKLRTKSP